MKTLVVEDDFTSRVMLTNFLTPFGQCDVAVDGEEAVQAFVIAWKNNAPYDVICLDIMMPNMDGQQALKRIREMEVDMGVPSSEEVKIIMTTALDDPRNVIEAYHKGGATGYLTKPIERKSLLSELSNLGLIGKGELVSG